MPVFISYRHTDREQAFLIQHRLNNVGIQTYLDVLDTDSKTTDNITQVITENIRKCTHLIALVSDDTIKSWWVPFEIGEATMAERRIATFKNTYSPLPEYLQKWPIMKDNRHIDMFIRAYLAESSFREGVNKFLVS
ncbi:toll/interleukin-1 receptor domain-containing protein [Endozoicomonas arenosclerae]|uniref:toll/interleukin-1 receptor domain-containing protein n=1 Tax=Endozoicomonas arenosclerae TaxID=1633495 RepID=UPI0009A1884C|nr:toll/interleukin-1 receptor domain-containing protein [Endozoicomonas arenosclerae]